MKLLKQINLRGTTILMVTHAKDIVDKMGKRVIVIEKGKIIRDNVGAYGVDNNPLKHSGMYKGGLGKHV